MPSEHFPLCFILVLLFIVLLVSYCLTPSEIFMHNVAVVAESLTWCQAKTWSIDADLVYDHMMMRTIPVYTNVADMSSCINVWVHAGVEATLVSAVVNFNALKIASSLSNITTIH